MEGDSYWFVMEDSLEALTWFGNAEVVPALRHLKDRAEPSERRARKIDELLSRPAHWLQGEPKELKVAGGDG
jgi:hypothetical protein